VALDLRDQVVERLDLTARRSSSRGPSGSGAGRDWARSRSPAERRFVAVLLLWTVVVAVCTE
jgi:hypothetical protein